MDNKKFQVTYTDPDTLLTRVEVIESGTPRFLELVARAFDPEQHDVVGFFVDDNTPVGLVGRAKQLRYRNKSKMVNKQIDYEIKEDELKFLNFKPFEIYGFTINREVVDLSAYTGDLLKIEIPEGSITPVDKLQINRVTYLLRLIQKFNDSLVDELSIDEEELENELDDYGEEESYNNSGYDFSEFEN